MRKRLSRSTAPQAPTAPPSPHWERRSRLYRTTGHYAQFALRFAPSPLCSPSSHAGSQTPHNVELCDQPAIVLGAWWRGGGRGSSSDVRESLLQSLRSRWSLRANRLLFLVSLRIGQADTPLEKGPAAIASLAAGKSSPLPDKSDLGRNDERASNAVRRHRSALRCDRMTPPVISGGFAAPGFESRGLTKSASGACSHCSAPGLPRFAAFDLLRGPGPRAEKEAFFNLAAGDYSCSSCQGSASFVGLHLDKPQPGRRGR